MIQTKEKSKESILSLLSSMVMESQLLMEEKIIEPVLQVKELSPESREEALACIAEEFVPPDKHSQFITGALRCLETSPTQVLLAPEATQRGACLLGLRNLGTNRLIGASLVKFYGKELIDPQLYLQIETEADSICLAPFSNLCGTAGVPTTAQVMAEYAYFWVDPKERGKGHGRILSDARREMVHSVFEGHTGGIFVLVNVPKRIAQAGEDVFRYLLKKEGEVNGVDASGRVRVLGGRYSLSGTFKEMGLPDQYTVPSVDRNAAPNKHILEGYGMRVVGMSRNLAPVYMQAING